MSGLKTGDRIERYEIETVLGRGGMASVYRVRHTQLGTLHALKVLEVGGGRAEARLLTEGRIQAGMRHPNIVTVTDILEVHGRPALLMEYVAPPTLSDRLDTGPFAPDEALRLLRGVISAVAHAHAHGLVHRDLKPGNVLLARGPDGDIPKVSDFGIAKVLDATRRETRSGAAMGTPQYMAPEQVRDSANVDPRADVYALGITIAELLTGTLPAYSGDLITHHAQMERDLTPELPASTPAILRTLVEGSVRFRPDDRFADAGAMVQLLGAGDPPRVSSGWTPASAGPAPTLPLDRGSVERGTLAPALDGTEIVRDLPAATERVGTQVAPAELPPKRTWAWGLGALVVAAAGLAAVQYATTPEEPVVDAAVQAQPTPTEPATVPAPAPPAATQPPPERIVAPTKKPARAPDVPAPVVVAKTEAAAEVPVEKVEPAKEAPAPLTGHVTVTGATVALRGPSGRSEPAGNHSPGRYELTATFPDGEVARVGTLEIRAGDEIRLRCNVDTRQCPH